MIKLFREIKMILFKGKKKEARLFSAIRQFKKQGRMGSFTPSSVQIQTQSVCNGRCIYCPYPQTSKTVPQGKMEWDTFVKVADEITAWSNLMRVELMMQNEPLMDNDLPKYVRYIKSLNPGLKVGITTNAMFLDQKKAREIAASGLDEVKISLDCFTAETYETLHPGFSFEKALEAIDCVNNLSGDKPSVILSFVLTNENVKEFESFVSFAKDKGLRWQTVYLLNRAGNVNGYEKLRLTKHSWRYRKLRFIHKYIYRTCTMPFFSMAIVFNGDVIICCQDWSRELVIGNVLNDPLLSIWDSDAYNTLRKKISGRRFNDIVTCAGCTLAELCS